MTHHDAKSFKKAAVLTGLTVLVGGAEISSADAATILQHQTFTEFKENSLSPLNLAFNQFNPGLGTLTQAQWSVDSTIFGTFIPTAPNSVTDTASISVPGASSTSTFVTTASGHPFPFGLTAQNAALPPYIGGGSIFATFTLTASCEAACTGEGWTGSVDLTYTYTPTVPLPAALPLFASGVAGLGFLGWLKRKVRKVTKQA